jgi:hypothetical protein
MQKILISIVLILFSYSSKAIDGFNSTDTTKPAFSIASDKNTALDSNILIVVNGVTEGTIKELKKNINTLFPPEAIEAINVWKGNKAKEKYGEWGKIKKQALHLWNWKSLK